jgi:hypothetical protein
VYNNFSKQHWVLQKRYSEFDDLFKLLSKLVPNCPAMPGKTFLKISSLDALNKRKSQLETFLKECVKRKDIVSSEGFRSFIEIEKNSPELKIYNPEKIASYEGLPLGLRDFIYLKEENVLIVACSDMSLISRIDSEITNVKLPWEEETNSHISIGGVVVYKLDGYNVVDRLWTKSYPKQTGVISWCNESSVLTVGLDDGKMFLYKANRESNFTIFDEILEIKPHTDRVMGISLDAANYYLYSCSTDKKFSVSLIEYIDNTSGRLI